MKEYSLQEVFNEEEGTEFKVRYEKGNYNRSTVKLVEKEKELLINRAKLVWSNGEDIQMKEEFITAKFVKLQEPVSFMKALKSDNKCNIKNNIIDNVHRRQIRDGDDEYKINIVQSLLDGNYYCMNDIIYAISGYMGCDDWEEFINNGEFYLESEE